MGLTPAEVRALLGAWAVDALDPTEAAMIDAMIAGDDALSRRADRMRQAVEGLGEVAAVAPPAAVRADVLRAAAAEPRPTVAPTDPIDLFANQVVALTTLLADLGPADWEHHAAPYPWTVHGLVAHLLVIEEYTSGQLGLRERRDDGRAPHLAMGAEEIEHELRRAPADTAAAWSAAASGTIAWLRGGGRGADEAVEFHGWPFRTATLLVARAFEVWTHADDIRRATGRPVAAPAATDLRAMSRFSVTSLPLLLPLVAPDQRFGGARVVLTGAGGGTFDLGQSETRDALLVVDVVDYCRHAARRIERNELDVSIEGDPAVADRLLAAAQVFAV